MHMFAFCRHHLTDMGMRFLQCPNAGRVNNHETWVCGGSAFCIVRNTIITVVDSTNHRNKYMLHILILILWNKICEWMSSEQIPGKQKKMCNLKAKDLKKAEWVKGDSKYALRSIDHRLNSSAEHQRDNSAFLGANSNTRIPPHANTSERATWDSTVSQLRLSTIVNENN